VMLAFLAAAASTRPALAQANFDRPGGDYLSAPVTSGDPAECALVCERDRRCRAWTFSYPTDLANRAVCWLKSNVPARVQSDCCVTGVRGAGVVERRNEAVETSIDRFGGDYKSFDLKSSDGGDDACKAACAADNKCRAWTYARPGYAGKDAQCFLKKDIKPPRRKAGLPRAWCGRTPYTAVVPANAALVGWAKAPLRRAHQTLQQLHELLNGGLASLSPPYDSASAGSTVTSGHSAFHRAAFAS